MARFAKGCDFCEAMRFVDSSSPAGPAPHSFAPLRAGWSATRLEIRLLETTGRNGEADRLRADAERSARRRLMRMIAVVAVAAVLLYVGVLSVVFEARYTAWRPRVDSSPPVGRWRWAHGIGVFVRSEIVGLMLSALAIWYGCGGPLSFVCLWASFFWFLPLLWLARRHLAAGPWKDFCRDFRLLPSGLTAGQVVRTGLGLLSIIWVSAAAFAPIVRWLGADADLSEIYFDPMVMDTPPRAALAGVNAVVWAPLAEELTFRGLVYMSLRAIVRPPIAAFAAASLFAAAHLYSFQASFVVFWTGLVFAFGLERYRTLLPALVSHVLLNLFFVISNIVAYR